MKVHTFSLIASASLIAFAAPAAAQPAPEVEVAQPEAEPYVETGSHIVVIGAMRDPAAAEIPAAPEDQSVPELPIVYEDEPTA